MASKVQVELNAQVQGFVDGMNQASESAKQYETDTRRVKDSLGNFRKEFSQAKKDVMNLAAAYSKLYATAKASQFGKEIAAQLEAAKQKASEMLDMQSDLNQELKNMASDTRVFDTLSEGMGVFMTTTASALGVIAQFTGNEEDARKAVVAFTTAQSALQAATKIQNALQKQSNLMLAIGAVQNKAAAAAATLKAAAEGKGAVATKASTVAQAAFNAVAKANPYVLLATAILGVAAALGTYMVASRKARTEEEKHQKQLEVTRVYHEKLNEQLGSSIPTFTKLCAEWRSLKTEAEKVQWIKNNQTEFNNLGISVNNVTEAENAFVKNTTAVVKSLMLRAQAAANYALAQEEWQKLLKENARLEELRGRKDLDPNEIKGVDKGNVKHEGRGWISELYSVNVDEQKQANIDRAKTQMQKYINEHVKLEQESGKVLKEAGIKAAESVTSGMKTASTKTKEAIKGSIEEAENELKKAQEKLKKIDVSKVGSDKIVKQTQEEIKRWEKELKDRKMKVEIELTANATEYLKAYEDSLKAEEERARAALIVNKLNKSDAVTIAKCVEELNKATNARKAYEKIANSVNQTQAEILSEYEKELKTAEAEAAAALILAQLHQKDANEIAKLTEEWEKATKARKDYEATKKAVTEEKPTATGSASYSDVMQGKYEHTEDDLTKAMNTLKEEAKKIDASTEEGHEKLEKIKEKYTEIADEQEKVVKGNEEIASSSEKASRKARKLADKYDLIGDAVASIGDSFASLSELAEDDPALNVAGIVAEAVANMFAGMARASAQAWELGPWGWAAFSAAALAQTLAMVAQIKSAAAFAEGGIVGGSSYSGDRIYSRLNSGEMVLNQRQQKNLFNLLDQDVMPQKGGANVTVTGVIRGTDIMLVQKNTNKVRKNAGTQIRF